MLSLLLSKWRLLSLAKRGGLLLLLSAAIAITGFTAGWKVSEWRNDSAQVDLMQLRMDRLHMELEEARAQAQRDEKRAASLSGLLEDIRRQRDLALDELDARPTLTRTVTKVLRDDCPVCNCPAFGADFRELWNDPTSARADRNSAPPAD